MVCIFGIGNWIWHCTNGTKKKPKIVQKIIYLLFKFLDKINYPKLGGKLRLYIHGQGFICKILDFQSRCVHGEWAFYEILFLYFFISRSFLSNFFIKFFSLPFKETWRCNFSFKNDLTPSVADLYLLSQKISISHGQHFWKGFSA